MLSGISRLAASVQTELSLVRELIRKQTASNQIPLKEMNRDWFSAKGKQLRSLLVLWCSCQRNNKISAQAVRTAALMELVHHATLVHDDIIDHAEIRRGKASMAHNWGATASVLYGDFLFTSALKIGEGLRKRKILGILTDAASRLCEGEILQNHHAFNPNLTPRKYLHIIGLKTASFFSACCEAGAVLSGSGKNNREQLRQFGWNFGFAYQIMNDCQDVIRDHSGKNHFYDLKEGKITLPFLFLAEAKDSRKRFIQSLFKAERSGKRLVSLLNKSPAVARSMKMAHQYLDKAQKTAQSLGHLKYQKELLGLVDVLKQDCLIHESADGSA
ncbi:MAG: polyprenyl synthetase family protein [Candidatus Aureabacteria bacterium]|nr:polyprenyl synthetase family protein [Candidatus Auribacterota bacterium]